MEEGPLVLVVAGPNGAGKSTIAPSLLSAFGIEVFVNADVIAQGLTGSDTAAAAMAAGRIMLERIDDLAREGESFAFETTLSSRSFAPRIQRMIDGGYRFALAYVWVPSADVSVSRVARRVRAGGHNVPEHEVRRRYERSIRELLRAVPADRTRVARLQQHRERGAQDRRRGPAVRPVCRVRCTHLDGDPREIRAMTQTSSRFWPTDVNEQGIDLTVTAAVRKELLKHKALGNPVVSWDDEGQPVEVPPEEIGLRWNYIPGLPPELNPPLAGASRNGAATPRRNGRRHPPRGDAFGFALGAIAGAACAAILLGSLRRR